MMIEGLGLLAALLAATPALADPARAVPNSMPQVQLTFSRSAFS